MAPPSVSARARSLPFVPEQGVVCEPEIDVDARELAILKSPPGGEVSM